jgi:glycine cleavage system H protein
MNPGKTTPRNLYYSTDHEWIDFQGSVAYVGVCCFKLTGIKTVQQFIFKETGGFHRQGTTIATIQYDDYEITVNMPVNGEIIQVNEVLATDTQDTLLQNAESDGWIALIVPARPDEKKNLLPPDQYRLNIKRKM